MIFIFLVAHGAVQVKDIENHIKSKASNVKLGKKMVSFFFNMSSIGLLYACDAEYPLTAIDLSLTCINFIICLFM